MLGRANSDHRETWVSTAAPPQLQDRFPADEIDHRPGASASHNCDDAADTGDQPARTPRLRMTVWDLTCTVALLMLLVVLVAATD
ncbi:hypothetical protein MUBE_01450 [Mycobacterium uberis]|uniref:Uncharacterized protein n=1 Tax=Mycobacterium uberis TaxID=2162698 RepID=A0A3E1HLA0_9MYCO|nr:hypothetical protein [Mycobacterium uberis]RFD27281.1 hypothetical protein MUBE_01450 [Mycobacterium uberis]